MKLMVGNTLIASYTRYRGRMYHAADTQHQGPSVSLTAFHQGQRPAPLVTTPAPAPRPLLECYPCPDTLRLVTRVQQGQPLPPLTKAPSARHYLACRGCGRVSGCRCGVPLLGDMGQRIAALQREQGRR